MNKSLLVFLFCTLFSSSVFANCFIAVEKDKVLVKEGECDQAYPPQSTFKIPLSLIGFDSGILIDESSPVWGCKPEYDHFSNVCKGDHNPHSWMINSCLWYSRVLTTKLGMVKFQDYINKFNYGNMDLSGGLTQAWISSSLKISPKEQIDFLQKFVESKLPVSKASIEQTKSLIYIQETYGGWKLYGKTGNGWQLDNKNNLTQLQQGWFIGYIEKDNRKVFFANHFVDNDIQKTPASFRARNDTLIRLWSIINNLEK